MKSKELIFDMDGTIVDLYGVNNWEKKLNVGDSTPYRLANPLYDMDTLNCIVSMLKEIGYRIKVVSWGSKRSSADFLKETAVAKKYWLEKYYFPADDVLVVPYGTPKEKFASIDSVLVDDNAEVCADFLKSARGILKRQVINATTENICSRLVDLIVKGGL